MICIHHKQCNSKTCPHRLPHPTNDFCYGGSCSWGTDTRCVPESKREQVAAILEAYLCGDKQIGNIVDAIDTIYKEAL